MAPRKPDESVHTKRAQKIPRRWSATVSKPKSSSKAGGIKGVIVKMKAITDVTSIQPSKIDRKSFMRKEARWARQQSAKDPMLALPDKWAAHKYKGEEISPREIKHPKILEAEKNGTMTYEKSLWYRGMPRNVNIPVAGIPSTKAYKPNYPTMLDYSLATMDHSLATVDGNEDSFHSRPSIKLIVPDILKAILVDDWENITKNNQLVPLPHPHPVSKILADYAEYETPKRPAGSSHVDILEETLAGLKEYFDKSLGRILLYRFERSQYAEVYKKWNSEDPEYQGKTPSETYGPEHLMRLIVSLPELVAQTNMDQQSVNRLREELTKLCTWLSKNTTEYFVSHYESPPQDYIQKAKE